MKYKGTVCGQNFYAKELFMFYAQFKVDDLVKNQNCDGKVKSFKFKAREFRVIR